jgi:D-lactate dehydrogenase
MKSIVYSTQDFERPVFDRLNDGTHQLNYLTISLNPATAHLAEGYDAVVVFVHDDVCAATLQVLGKCGVRLVALRGAGYNKIDVKAALALNIKVVRVPAYSPQAIAEHAVALILALARKTHKTYNHVREGNFSLGPQMGFNLYGKTVGIIGMGRIGNAFASIMNGFGCRVVAFDICEPLEVAGVEFLPFEQVLQVSDIVSIHCPLTSGNRHLFGYDAFKVIKHGAILINTARGAIVDTIAAIDALKTGRLGALGIDVYENEEGLFMQDLSATVVQDDIIARLMALHNVIVTPHQAFFTKEAVEEIISTTLENITAFRTGNKLGNEVLA